MKGVTHKVPWPTNGFSYFNQETHEGYVYLARDGMRVPDVDPKSLAF